MANILHRIAMQYCSMANTITKSDLLTNDHSGNIYFCKNVYLEEKYNHKNGVLGIAFIRIQAFFWLLQSAEYGVLRSERANVVVVVKSIQ